MNDYSPVDSQLILDEYAARDSRIIIIKRDQNGGVGAARRSRLDRARGELITFVDPDDTVDLNAFEESVAHFDNDTDLVYFSIKAGGKPSKLRDDTERFLRTKDMPGKHTVTVEFIERTLWTIWSKVFRKSIIDRYQLRNLTGLWQDDLDFFFRYLSLCRCVYGLSDPKYHWLIREDSTSARPGKHKKEELNAFIAHEHILQFLRQHNLLDHHSPLVRGLVRNILHHFYSLDSSNRQDAIRHIRSLFNKWDLWSVNIKLDGYINYEAALWRLKTPDWILPLVKLFYLRKINLISLRFLGINILKIFLFNEPHRYKLLGIGFGRPTERLTTLHS